MSGAIVEISAGGGRIGQELERLAAKLADLHDPLAEMGEMLVASTHARFGQGVTPEGAPWAPLAPSVVAQKKGPGILRESFHLQGSIRYQVSGDELRVGTDLPYAAAHQFGLPARTIRPKAGKALAWPGAKHPVHQVNHPGLKARPFLGLSAEDETAMLGVLQDYLAAE